MAQKYQLPVIAAYTLGLLVAHSLHWRVLGTWAERVAVRVLVVFLVIFGIYLVLTSQPIARCLAPSSSSGHLRRPSPLSLTCPYSCCLL